MPFIGQQPLTGAYSKLDSITTSATATYNLQLDGSAYSPASANHLLVSLNGVMQAPQDSFTVSGSTITFASALTSSDNIDFIMALGDVLNIGTPSDGTVTAAKIGSGAVTDAKIAADAVTTSKIASGAVDTTELASSLNLSSKTLTMPQKFNGLVHFSTVNPTGTGAFVQDISAYEQVMVFMNNVSSTSQGANIRMNAGTTSNGTTGGNNFNFIYHDFFVTDTTNMYGWGSGGAEGIIADNTWSNDSAGTNGYMLIGGIGTSNTTNKRLTYSGMIMKQSPSNQEVEIIGGQTQTDGSKYTHIRISSSSGNFAGSTRFTFFGINHYNV